MELTVQFLHYWPSMASREKIVKCFMGSENLYTPLGYNVRMNFYRVSIEHRT
jgi:hypothetical protein